MKISVSLPDDDIAFVDRYAKASNDASRSAVIHKAVAMLKTSELSADYEAAFTEWDDEAAWDQASADGLEVPPVGEPNRPTYRRNLLDES